MRTVLITLLLLAVQLPALAGVRAVADRTRGPVDAPFLLTVEAEQREAAELDLKPLESAFKILGSRSSALSSFTGSGTRITQRWLITLAPRRAGTLTIPALRVGDESTAPLSFEALPIVATQPPLFLESAPDQNLAYVRSPVRLGVRLYYRVPLTHAEISEPLIEGVRIYADGDQQHFREQRDGIEWGVIEQRYLLLPERAGRFVIPELVFRGTDSNNEEVTAKSAQTDFQAVALPRSADGAQAVATDLKLAGEWLEKPERLQPGDKIRRRVVLEAHNLPSDWLPELQVRVSDGLRVMPARREVSEQLRNGVLVTRVVEEQEFLIRQAGQQQIELLEIRWWDPVREQADVSRLEGISLVVDAFSPSKTAPASRSPAPARAERPDEPAAAEVVRESGNDWLTWFFAVMTALLAMALGLSELRARRLQRELNSLGEQMRVLRARSVAEDQRRREQEAFANLARSCHRGGLIEIADALIYWAQSFWPDESVVDLDDVERLAGLPTLSYLLKDLDRRIRERDLEEPWYGELALKQLARLRTRSAARAAAPVEATEPEKPAPEAPAPAAQRPTGRRINEIVE